MHHGEPKCFVNEVCTACFASVVHRLCEFGAFLAQEVTKICILMRKSISLVQVWAESRTSGENRHRILQVIHDVISVIYGNRVDHSLLCQGKIHPFLYLIWYYFGRPNVSVSSFIWASDMPSGSKPMFFEAM